MLVVENAGGGGPEELLCLLFGVCFVEERKAEKWLKMGGEGRRKERTPGAVASVRTGHWNSRRGWTTGPTK